MADTNPTTAPTQHWAYRLPPIVDPRRGPIYWAPEAIAGHKHPEYWAWMWGYSSAEIAAAKEHQPNTEFGVCADGV